MGSVRRLGRLAAQLLRAPDAVATGAAEAAAAEEPADDAPVLSPQQRQHFAKQGYVVVRGAVAPPLCDAVAREMFEFVGAHPDEPGSWYSERPPGSTRFPVAANENTMLNMYHTQAMWDVRTSRRIWRAMAELWGTPKLWASVDTCDLKPPMTPAHPEWGRPLHLHTDLPADVIAAWQSGERQETLTQRLQGVVYLADTDEDGGGFRCIPGFLPPVIDEWFAAQQQAKAAAATAEPAAAAAAAFDFETVGETTPYRAKTIAAKKGDMVIWNSYLPHGSGVNSSQRPRLCQCEPSIPILDDTAML